MGIFRLEISESLWLLLIAIKYLSIFHLKIVPAANQEKAMVLSLKPETTQHNISSYLIVHLTEVQPAEQQ